MPDASLPYFHLQGSAASPEVIQDVRTHMSDGLSPMSPASGAAVFDKQRLWRPDKRLPLGFTPNTRTRAEKFLRDRALLNGFGATSKVIPGFVWERGSKAVIIDPSKNRTPANCADALIDQHVMFGLSVFVNHPLTNQLSAVPAIGAGTKARLIYTEEGLAGFQCDWPFTIIQGAAEGKVLDPSPSLERMGMAHLSISPKEQPQLAYASFGEGDARTLWPIWVFTKSDEEGPATVPSVGTQVWVPAIQSDAHPLFLAKKGNAGIQQFPPAAVCPPPAYWATWLDNGSRGAPTNVVRFAAELDGSMQWNRAFCDGDAQALFADWTTNAGAGIESAELAYYCGEAAGSGWLVSDGRLIAPPAAVPVNPILAGDGRLRWLAVSACGPLQDGCAEGGGRVQNWIGAFRGLRMLLGYASTVASLADQGRLFANAARSETLLHAWFLTAFAHQAAITKGAKHSPVWVAAMYPRDKGGQGPIGDRLFGPVPGRWDKREEFVAIWSPA